MATFNGVIIIVSKVIISCAVVLVSYVRNYKAYTKTLHNIRLHILKSSGENWRILSL
jgi:hypothetical protein